MYKLIKPFNRYPSTKPLQNHIQLSQKTAYKAHHVYKKLKRKNPHKDIKTIPTKS